jgi:hypothetical protein
VIRLGLCATATLVPTLGGVWGPVALAAGRANAGPDDDGSWLRRDLFEIRVGDYFTVRKPRSGSISLRLIRVEDALSAKNAGTVGHPDCFTLIFRGANSSRLEQGTYRVQSSTLGTFALFLVPGPVVGSTMTYAATFNRVVQE